MLALDPFEEVLAGRDHVIGRHRDGIAFLRRKADDREAAAIRATAHALLDQRRARARADNEDATLEQLCIDRAQESRTEQRDEHEPDREREAEDAAADIRLRHRVVEDHEAERTDDEGDHLPREEAEPRLAHVCLMETERDHAEHDRSGEDAAAQRQHLLDIDRAKRRRGVVADEDGEEQRNDQQQELACAEQQLPADRVLTQEAQHSVIEPLRRRVWRRRQRGAAPPQ